MQQQSMSSMSQNQGVMMEPPEMVTVKDSLYLADMLSWNLLAMKKAHFFAQNIQDQNIKLQAEKCGQMHQQHYEKILAHLNESNQSSLQGLQQQ
ncbi:MULTISPECIES: hypothetical protein [Bacillaceae]|uniref:hypothetical protein n=1 Tax=Bacillaceae TaxID=186817 RepID=UPI001E2D76C7|nr:MULTISPECIES: hypothetical protein [Bacillaceae]MCE4050258.1 hypothetical protein [Bacillus sp. Au-Bac7]MCM3029493.1 hypothetical protein [Niallia sp. MER 6]MDL0435201.1 hypothetical protein [Niallia sp. SS-2023]UPO87034.1 hypothetical protein L8T27_015920 [Niallia sp. Man26]